MKAAVKLALPGFTGSMDDMVIYYNSKLNRLIARKKVRPQNVPSNADFVAISRLVKRLGVSVGYIADCRRYVDLYNQKNRRHNRAMSSWNNVFFQIFMRVKKAFPEINLDLLSKEDIIAHDYPCQTIAGAVRANLLEMVRDYQNLDHNI